MTFSRWTDLGVLFIRLAIATVFIMHGGQKLLFLGHDQVAAGLAQGPIPYPSIAAWLLIAAELGGGFAMLFGLLTRFAGVVLAFVMGVAIWTVHLPNGFFLPAGMEFALTLLLVNLGITFTGAGRFSIDALFHRDRSLATTPAPPRYRRHAA